MLLTIIYYVAGATQRNDGRQRNVRRRSVCHCCRRNRLQRRRFSLSPTLLQQHGCVLGVRAAAIKYLEPEVISSSLDGWTVAWRPARWGGWSSALITLSSAVLPLSLTTPTFPLSPCCLYIGMSLVRRPAVSACCIRQWTRLIDWVRLNVPPTHYRSYGDRFLRVKWPNQQCQSTEGR